MSEGKVVTVGWVSLSRSGKSLSIKVLNQMFFVPLRDLYPVLDDINYYRSSLPRLAVELNPVDEDGKPTKRRGLILRSSRELEEFKKLFDYEKLSKLLSIRRELLMLLLKRIRL